MEKRNWENTEYTKIVRITYEDLEWLKKNKGKMSIARKLKEIIKKERHATP